MDDLDRLLRLRYPSSRTSSVQPDPPDPATAQRLVELRKETEELAKLIDDLLARERAGDKSARAELDPIVLRDGALRMELWTLEKSLGLLGPQLE